MSVFANRRHLTITLPDCDITRSIEQMRRHWDPAMAAVVPAHITAIYPEEVVDESVLVDRLGQQLARARSFAIDVRGVFAEDDGRGGVFLLAHDRTGALNEIKRNALGILATRVVFPYHITLTHPRTSNLGPACFASLKDCTLEGSITVSELSWTETTALDHRKLQRFELLRGRVQQVAAVLRRGKSVLLCHRSSARQYFPNVWDLPGGHVEPGEHAAEALKRELKEELGIRVARLPDQPSYVLSDDTLDVDLSVWFVDNWQGDPMNSAPEEHDDLAWHIRATWTTLPLAHPSYPALLAAAERV